MTELALKLLRSNSNLAKTDERNASRWPHTIDFAGWPFDTRPVATVMHFAC